MPNPTENHARMQFENFGGIDLFRPSIRSEHEMRFASENHLRSKYSVGKYTEKEKINEILKYQFSFYEKSLEELISEVASRDFLDFVLFQFDSASEIENLYSNSQLTQPEANRWKEIGPDFRRATKYIAERVVLLQPDASPKAKKEFLLSIAEKIWICGEEMISLYIASDQTHSIFPNQTFLEIFPVGEKDYFFHGLTRDLPDSNRIYFDSRNRHRFIPEPSFPLNFEEHDRVIGDTVKNKLGVTYKEALQILGQIIEGSLPSPTGFPIPFVPKKKLVGELCKAFQVSSETIEKVISGFTLSKEQMETESRAVWNSKQEYRAYRRAFFEMPHSSGKHITFSKAMAKESLILLLKDTAFKRFPKEWLDPSVERALGRLSNLAGKWFENIVAENIASLGFKGEKSAKAIGLNANRIKIPSEIGEIDYLGYSEKEKVLLLAECKLVRDSFEPKLFRDDIDDFINSPKAYIKKFTKKSNWVQSNIASVSRALESTNKFKKDIKPQSFAQIIVTFLPSIASYFIEEYPCVSLTEFMLDYEALGKYPYEIGVSSVK